MLQAEEDFLHRDTTFEDHTDSIKQDEAGDEPQDQVPVIGIFALDLAGLRGQQVLQRAEVRLDPTAPPPGPDQTWRRTRGRPAEQVEAITAWCVDDDDRDRSIASAGRREADIADPWLLGGCPARANPPGARSPVQSPGARRAAGRHTCACLPPARSPGDGAPRVPATASRQTRVCGV